MVVFVWVVLLHCPLLVHDFWPLAVSWYMYACSPGCWCWWPPILLKALHPKPQAGPSFGLSQQGPSPGWITKHSRGRSKSHTLISSERIELNETLGYLGTEKIKAFFYCWTHFLGGGTPWQCGGESEAAGGPAGGEEPGTAQGEKEGKPAVATLSLLLAVLLCMFTF